MRVVLVNEVVLIIKVVLVEGSPQLMSSPS